MHVDGRSDSPWFHCDNIDAERIALPESEARHAAGSRRLAPGDAVTLFDGRGQVAVAVIEPLDATIANSSSAGRGRAAGLAGRVIERRREPAPARRLTIATAAPKGDRLEWLVEKCTELGVDRFGLCNFERSVVRAGDSHVVRLRRTAIEACKQCRRAWLPELVLQPPLQAPLLIAHPGHGAAPLATVLPELPRNSSPIVLVGPEGGFSPAELAAFEQAGGPTTRRVQLGRHILRIETAAVAIAALWAATATA